jgi:hypothetical protein
MPFSEGDVATLRGKPLRFNLSYDRKVVGKIRARGRIEREMLLIWLKRRGSLRGQKAQESKRPRPGLNSRVAQRGTALTVGGSRWSAVIRPSTV